MGPDPFLCSSSITRLPIFARVIPLGSIRIRFRLENQTIQVLRHKPFQNTNSYAWRWSTNHIIGFWFYFATKVLKCLDRGRNRILTPTGHWCTFGNRAPINPKCQPQEDGTTTPFTTAYHQEDTPLTTLFQPKQGKGADVTLMCIHGQRKTNG